MGESVRTRYGRYAQKNASTASTRFTVASQREATRNSTVSSRTGCAIHPRVAAMAMRPCLSSASRYDVICSRLLPCEKPSGSLVVRGDSGGGGQRLSATAVDGQG